MTEPNVAPAGEAQGPPPADPKATDKKESRSPNADDLKAMLQNESEKRAAAERTAREMQVRMQQLEQVVMGRQQPNPADDDIQQLRLRAQLGDQDARTQLFIGQQAAEAKFENALTKAMVKAKVAAEDWDEVEGLVKQSNFQMSVADAVKRAKGTSTRLESDNEALRKKLEAKEKELELERTRVRVPTTAVTLAPVPVDGGTISKAQFDAILRAGGEQAKIIKARVNSAKDSSGHLDIDYSQK